jgi:hypothetical protein
MPTYQIECYECGSVVDQHLTFSEYDKIKSGESGIQCHNCGLPAGIGFSPGKIKFILKEGESGGWASKSIKESSYRKKRRIELARRERDHVFKPSLQPNYKGVETGSWVEAREMARNDKGNTSASTYNNLVKSQ